MAENPHKQKKPQARNDLACGLCFSIMPMKGRFCFQ